MNTDVENSGIQLQEMLELQLAEVEMLQSMFPNPGEFTLDSKTVLEELQSYVDGRIRYEYLGTRIGFTVKILTSSTPENPLELVCNFPHEYPSILPEVFTRAPAMDRESHRHLSEDLHEFISSVETGQIIVGSVIEWLQENAHRYLKEDLDLKNSSSRQISNKEETSFTRLWIYSHHIYSKFKRRDIVDWASELGLNGFSMPGKPGIICVEGATEGVDEFWYRIRRLNWKRIMIKEQEVMELDGKKPSVLCKFLKFQELELEVQGGKGRNYHMNLGKFKEFLEEHDSGYMFLMYFGIEGKSAGE
ncbi:RWD domain-containing protein 2B-like [Littorina saxatilis]|uniref:RWD domain-containing protein n=1 Tax=Littorina saxatilis TaxID=31220 RepID=A0AAN9B3C9_9CAEN